MLLNTNAVHFCDTFFRHRAMFSKCLKKVSRNQKSGYIKIFYNNIRYFRSLHKMLKAVNALQIPITDRIPKLPTDRHFLFFIWYRTIHSESLKNSGNIGLVKSKPKVLEIISSINAVWCIYTYNK